MEVETATRTRLSRTQLVKLASHQRHLRHLSCIFGRNIDPSLLPPAKSGCKAGLLKLSFTLHSADDQIVLYRSEVIEDSLNPSWNEFDSGIFPEKADAASSNLIVRIWAQRCGTEQVIIQYNLNLYGLVLYGDQLKTRGKAYEANTVIFRMFGQFYMYPSKFVLDSIEEMKNDLSKQKLLKVEQDAVSWAYKMSSVKRVHCMLKAVHETKQQVRKARFLIETNQKKQEVLQKKLSERESLHKRAQLLEEELKALRAKLHEDSENTRKKKLRIKDTENSLRNREDDLEQYISSMKICHSSHIVNRETLVKVNAQLIYRRKQLAAELSYIFPVVEIPQKGSAKQEYAITGVRLPISDALTGEDDEMLSVALGNTCHLTTMMAKLMGLPLRYPIRPMGSRSSILDLVKDRLNEKEREFPLYLKGREKYQFHYGVYLLNKDIAQLRYHCGLGTSDLRHTLVNLRHLFENKFGVKIIVRPDTETLQQTISSQVPRARTISDNDELDAGAATVDGTLSKSREMEGISRPIHKAKSQGNLVNNGNSRTLPTPTNRTQMHKLLRSKKSVSRSKSVPDNESPTAADRLLEMPFEEIAKGGLNKPRSHTAGEGSAFDSEIDKRSSNEKVKSEGFHSEKPLNVGTSNALNKYHQGDGTSQTEYSDSACLDCLRNGNRCVECIHKKSRPVSLGEVHFEEGDVNESRLYSRQYSDILLIPGPFDYHDQIAAIEDANSV